MENLVERLKEAKAELKELRIELKQQEANASAKAHNDRVDMERLFKERTQARSSATRYRKRLEQAKIALIELGAIEREKL